MLAVHLQHPGCFMLLYMQLIFIDMNFSICEKLRLFTDLLESTKNLFFINDFPVFLLLDDEIAADLSKNGINISSLPYPDPTMLRQFTES